MLAAQKQLPLNVSARCALVTLEFVRNLRGCDADSVRHAVGDATHPQFIRWAFDLGTRTDGLKRELRFWKEDVLGVPVRNLEPAAAIGRILGGRERFARGEIEVAWTVHHSLITRWIGGGEVECVSGKLTRASLAAFLERRLQ